MRVSGAQTQCPTTTVSRTLVPVLGLAALAGAVLIQTRLRSTERRDVVRFAFPPLTRWAARRALVGRSRARRDPSRGRFTRADVQRLVARAWQWYDAQVPRVPTLPTVGSRLNLKLACWTVALFHSLLDAGVDRDEAVDLVADVMWRLFQQWGRVGQVLTRLRPELKTRPRHLLPDGTIDLGFPFSPPAYVARPISGDGARSFEVVRCPAADYFRAEGLADLGLAAFCDSDYGLSEMQGLTLRRTCTLMAGDDHCDFRWPPASEPASPVSTSLEQRAGAIGPADRPLRGEEEMVIRGGH